VVLDENGKKMKGQGNPSSETPFHLFFYQTRPEIGAIIHAHPPYTIACSMAEISFEKPILAETACTLGAIPTVPYRTPTTRELVEAIGQCQNQRKTQHTFPLGGPRAFILQRHGAITLGKDLEEAYGHMETLERTAQIAYLSQNLGKLTALPQKEIDRLEKMASQK
jgi:L-fuculose-phosphate aldolase